MPSEQRKKRTVSSLWQELTDLLNNVYLSSVTFTSLHALPLASTGNSDFHRPKPGSISSCGFSSVLYETFAELCRPSIWAFLFFLFLGPSSQTDRKEGAGQSEGQASYWRHKKLQNSRNGKTVAGWKYKVSPFKDEIMTG